MPAFSLNDQPRPYAPDPLYGQMFGNAGMGGMGGAFGAGMGVNGGMPPVPPFDTGYDAGFDAYGFDDDPTGYGSGALYSGGAMVRNKRSDADREFNRFSGVRIEDLASEILLLSKDQHGCRYLQKVLEDGDPAHRDLIFREIFGHLPELMVDPFGNYLCQKLLEFSSEEQRNSIVDSVANDLVTISLNMHGTRAVQKMVDFLASPRQAKQIRTLIYALSMNVVALIKDLNGNHVRSFLLLALSNCRFSLHPGHIVADPQGHPKVSQQAHSRRQPVHLQRHRCQSHRSRYTPTRLLRLAAIHRPRIAGPAGAARY
jgi:hypothetical protein